MSSPSPLSPDQVGAAEVIAALSLATDLGMGFPLEHGLHSTLVAMRLCQRMGVDAETTSQAYYSCLLGYVGCTADAEVQAELFNEGAPLDHFTPVMFGSRMQTVAGIMRALAASPGSPPTRAMRAAARLPGTYGQGGHMIAGVTFFMTSAVGLIVLSRRIANDARWSSLATYTLVAGITAVAGFVAAGVLVMPDDAPLHDWAGLVQRALILLVIFPCLTVLSLRLLRVARAS